MNGKNYTLFVIVFVFMEGVFFIVTIRNYKKEKNEKSEQDYYSAIGNWSFSDINYKSKTLTNQIYESEAQKHIKKNSKVLKYYPECREILATDFSETMIKNANENLKAMQYSKDTGFKDVELFFLHAVEYYKTEADLYALLVKVPVLDVTSDGKFYTDVYSVNYKTK